MKANGVKRVDSRWDRIRDSIWLLQRSCASQPIKKLKIMKNLDILKGKNDRKNNMDILTSHHLLHLNYVYKYFKIIFYLLLKYSELESWVLIRLDLIKLRVITVVWGLNSSAAVVPYLILKVGDFTSIYQSFDWNQSLQSLSC